MSVTNCGNNDALVGDPSDQRLGWVLMGAMRNALPRLHIASRSSD
jgi:hypothetical protein